MVNMLPECFKKMLEATTQDKLADAMGVSASAVSQIYQGHTLPRPEKLALLHDKFGVGYEELLRAWIYDTALRGLEKTDKKVIDRDTIAAAIEHDLFPDRTDHIETPPAPLLTHFPGAFDPLVVVTGDKREPNPKTVGDLAAISASTADLHYLLWLGLPRDTEIISDKYFVQLPEEQLQKRYGKSNLLVIGSPASNFLARRINSTALFKFGLDSRDLEQLEKIAKFARHQEDQFELKKLAHDNRDTLRFFTNRMFAGGLFDPTYKMYFRGFRLSRERDYGVITLARNPFTSKEDKNTYFSVMVAGLHLPGTMLGVKLLSESERFEGREFGGVFEIDIPSGKRWEDRLVNAEYRWEGAKDEKPKGPDEALEAIIRGLTSFIKDERREKLWRDDAEKCRDFANDLKSLLSP